MKTTHLTLAAILTAGSALLVPAHAATILTGGTESNSSSYSVDFNVGYRFTSTTNQSLTALGLWDSSSDGFGASSYQVGLWDVGTTALLGSVTIDDSDALDTSLTVAGGQWRYESLGSPIALVAGRTYTLGFNTGTAGLTASDGLYIDYTSLTTAGSVTIADARYSLAGTSLAMPSGFNSAGTLFIGMVNAQIIPEPGSGMLLAAGLTVLALHRRRAIASAE